MKDASATEGKTVECAPGGGNKKALFRGLQ